MKGNWDRCSRGNTQALHVNHVSDLLCSADMLEDIKVPWVILGHSERRSLLKESEEVKLCPARRP